MYLHIYPLLEIGHQLAKSPCHYYWVLLLAMFRGNFWIKVCCKGLAVVRDWCMWATFWWIDVNWHQIDVFFSVFFSSGHPQTLMMQHCTGKQQLSAARSPFPALLFWPSWCPWQNVSMRSLSHQNSRHQPKNDQKNKKSARFLTCPWPSAAQEWRLLCRPLLRLLAFLCGDGWCSSCTTCMEQVWPSLPPNSRTHRFGKLRTDSNLQHQQLANANATI